ncbi:hypothetical protein C9374_005499 [Naegleria lovaniensis]|uniref:Cyclic nucleotide-binding domain-containing protein n=1 Tax=Naegleria lovaniensis TaxID=51637 RepID=A0AA88GQ24_NAELO|nr:uncharacterized protein C9374_005499 [Naegleria lovaniensis]KAG2382297.1 hypothetical protein C9374_005499 [Naegleria lovaniensis]
MKRLLNSSIRLRNRATTSIDAGASQIAIKVVDDPEIQKEKIPLWKKMKDKVFSFYIFPDSTPRIVMDFIMSFVILYNAVTAAYLACFEEYIHYGFLIVNILMDLLGILNIFAHLLEVKMVGADPERSRIGRLLSYWKLLLIDIVSYCTLYDWFLLNYPYFRLFRIIPILTLRFGDYYKTVEQKSGVNPIYLRIVKSVIYLSIIIHWFSCLYFLNLNQYHEYGNILIQTDATDNLKYLVFMNLSGDLGSYNFLTRIRQYIGSMYFATLFLVGFGTDVPQDELGALYSIMNAVFGVMFIASVVGVVSNLVNQMNQKSSKFNRKLDDITGYLKFRKVNTKLISDSRNFLGIIQRANRELKSDDDILEDLELETKRKVSQYLHKDLVKKVPFMKDMEELFIQEICLYLEHTIILENYYVMQFGEVGREMFFLGKGSVEIVGPQGQIWASLPSGSFFGEVALILNSKRMASVRTKEICEVFILHKDDFDNVLSRFPEAKKKIQEEAEKRTQAAQKTAETKNRVQTKVKTIVKLFGKRASDVSPRSANAASRSNSQNKLVEEEKKEENKEDANKAEHDAPPQDQKTEQNNRDKESKQETNNQEKQERDESAKDESSKQNEIVSTKQKEEEQVKETTNESTKTQETKENKPKVQEQTLPPETKEQDNKENESFTEESEIDLGEPKKEVNE